MKDSTEAGRYSSASIALHWVMLLLLIAAYASMELKGVFPKGSEARDVLKQWHFMIGLTVLAVVGVRILVNVFAKAPQIVPEPPRWQHLMAKAMHLALYALMIALPVMGWLILSAKGQSIPFWGISLPPLTGESATLAKQVKNIHETLATVGYVLIGLHAAAALFHHYFIRDNTLVSMLPKMGR